MTHTSCKWRFSLPYKPVTHLLHCNNEMVLCQIRNCPVEKFLLYMYHEIEMQKWDLQFGTLLSIWPISKKSQTSILNLYAFMIFIRLQTDTIFMAFSRLANVHIYRRKGHKNIETHPQILQDLNQICHNSARFGNSLQQHLGNNRTHSIHI